MNQTNIKAGLIAVCLVVMFADASARPTHHRHTRHHERYDPAFCRDIIIAFDRLPVRDLQAFVASVPERKRKQAARCLTRMGR